MSFIGTGVYPLRRAARLVGVDAASVRRWLIGYARKGVSYEPLWTPELVEEDLGEPVIGFRDLLELRLVAAFAKHGVALRTIRVALDFARAEFRTDYPLTSRRFLTDGRAIFLEAVRTTADGGEMLDIAKRQFVFTDIIRPSLYEGIEYNGVRASRWFPMGGDRKVVVLDPGVQFGTPIVAGAGIPTDTIYAAFGAEGKDRRRVARIFDISPQQVDAAVRFESKLAA